MTVALAADVIAERLAALRAAVSALPHEDDIATARERERVSREWSRLTHRHSTLEGAAYRLAKVNGKLVPLQEWREHLLGAIADCSAQLAAQEELPPATRRANWRREDALRASLKAAHFGVEYLGGMLMLPLPLADALRARGVVPEQGADSVWTGRGSLTATEERIGELERQRAEAQAVIDAELSTPV